MKIKANELKNVRVERISLVKRGANRIPFRIVKNDNGGTMKLKHLFKKSDGGDSQKVVGYIVKKSDKSDQIAQAITKAIEVIEIDEQEDAVIIKGDGFDPEGHLIRLSDDVVAVARIEKGIDLSSKNVFTDTMATNGVVPSLYLATDMLVRTIENIVYSEGDMEKTIAEFERAINDYSAYVKALMQAVPAQFFKQEAEIRKNLAQSAPATEPVQLDRLADEVQKISELQQNIITKMEETERVASALHEALQKSVNTTINDADPAPIKKDTGDLWDSVIRFNGFE